MPITAILFDLDGTLVDSNEFHVETWQRVFASHGRDIEVDRIRGQIGKGGDLLIPTLLPDTDDATREAMSALHGEIFGAEYLSRVQPFPGAHDLLARVHAAGQRIVLASSAKQTDLDHYVELLDAGGLLEAMVSADDVEHSKPAPDIFAAALAKLDVPAGAVMMIGDTPYDIDGAAKCGIKTIGLRSGGFPDAELAGAVAVYDDVAALLAGYADSPLSA